MSPADSDPAFIVSYPPAVLAKLRRWGERATRMGLGGGYLTELRRIERHLRTDPRGWGDPQYDLPGLSLTAYFHYSPALIVEYFVHTTRPVVFVQAVRLTPGSPLEQTGNGTG